MRFVITILFACFAASAGAQQADTKLALAAQLVKLMDVADINDKNQEACLQLVPANPIDLKTILASNPNAYGGVTPKSELWPKIEAAYGAYQKVSCLAESTPKVVSLMTEAYAEHASEETLRASIAFYSSAAGREMRAATTAAVVQQQLARMNSAAARMQAEGKRLEQAVRRIMADYQANPR